MNRHLVDDVNTRAIIRRKSSGKCTYTDTDKEKERERDLKAFSLLSYGLTETSSKNTYTSLYIDIHKQEDASQHTEVYLEMTYVPVSVDIETDPDNVYVHIHGHKYIRTPVHPPCLSLTYIPVYLQPLHHLSICLSISTPFAYLSTYLTLIYLRSLLSCKCMYTYIEREREGKRAV